ncbi:nucleotide sugar dehydrogenase [Magnetovibrio sp.]|uniref:nucleotide sugar dehydrogenase n=1 Tax=Magnetovibrio sp. TaxID=2024836 RepID=UPI002F95694E
MSTPTIAFCGMTHLGLNSAIAVADMGFPVVCFDPNADLIATLNDRVMPVQEPGLDDMLAKNADHIRFTADLGDLAGCDVAYIAPDVPTDDKGQSDLTPIRAIIDLVSANLNDTAILVVLCQVPPGFTRDLAFPKDRLYYQVETLVFGCAIERARHPERYIVGCAQPETPLPAAFAAVLGAADCPILPMRYESAELAKISINMCLVASVSVANTMAELCENIGADWSEIVPALKLDRRIGQYSYLKPGLGIAGGNLERDLTSVCNMAAEHGSDAGVVHAWIANSKHRKDWALRTLHAHLFQDNPDAELGVLGLTYKEDTHSIKNSPSLAMLANIGPYAVKAYDPAIDFDPAWHPNGQNAETPLDACRDVDAIAIMTPWGVFKDLDPADIKSAMRGDLVIDPYAVLDANTCAAAGLRRITLGKPAQ